ncbi:MAG: hypothetical protein JXA71_10680, partial [Chitinispirillaceae bacterium]|nr:hypothetical protein [Chitinispirillaceae bacterium]
IFCVFKMFSPQFLLLLVPLVALVPFTGLSYAAFAVVFAGCCCMSTFIYPYFYTSDIIIGPTGFGLFLLGSRAIMLIGMTTVLICWIIGYERKKQQYGSGSMVKYR